MAYSLRLPDALDAAARAKADYLGISLNALVCVALDAYLRSPGESAQAGTKPATTDQGPVKTGPDIPQVGDTKPKPTRAEKQASYERDKAERRRLFAPG
jgi:hypothetical protein